MSKQTNGENIIAKVTKIFLIAFLSMFIIGCAAILIPMILVFSNATDANVTVHVNGQPMIMNGQPVAGDGNVQDSQTGSLTGAEQENVAENEIGPDVSKLDYYLSSYDVDITVDENRVFTIREEIEAYFNVPKHGINRSIPFVVNLYRPGADSERIQAEISDITVDAPYEVMNDGGYKKIRIGDANQTVTGAHTYVIEYTYDMGNDTLKDMDEMYLNIIGYDSDTVIDNITFSIHLPKEFNAEDIVFSKGYSFQTGATGLEYSVDGNTITGRSLTPLEANQGINIRVLFPEEYFTERVDYKDLLLKSVPFLCLGIAFLLWWFLGRDDKMVSPVMFAPPKGYCSAEIGMLYKGKAGSEEIGALILELANKGHWIIEENRNEHTGQVTGFSLRFLKKRYEGNNVFERAIFNGIMETALDEKPSMKNGEIVATGRDIYAYFRISDDIRDTLNSKNHQAKYFGKTNKTIKWVFILMMIILNVVGFVLPLYEYVQNLAASIIMVVIMALSGWYMVFTAQQKMDRASKMVYMFFGGLGFFIPFAGGGVIEAWILYDRVLLGLLCMIGYFALILVLGYMPKRTKEGNRVYGEILGFRNFLVTAEKDRLDTLFDENPNYYYDILPYTYVLEVSDKWVGRFEDLINETPDWYRGSNFDSDSFVRDTVPGYCRDYSSGSSSSSSSSGSSSSGSSGGGGGGGGVSSW